ncbi:aldolase/citrate lyase family protein [Marinifilum sp. D714]|uniref:aldolase/citrate lyase family protein n=1 Tax=Marinifilum sp. D714 TaxID=2937523 RepID=UPI0027C7BA05|nr:aldolase/citrate lyase family protein [Marinifilum sp. D714]MDQ2178543.1 HpcH/HpaI aldolase/citrate lyase family protein [Marinifilum sp. D714]
MKLMILTAEPGFAKEAQDAGIDRIFFDLEYINKAERQKGRDTVLSDNNIDDIPKVRKVLTDSQLLVRINPIHQYTKDEIEKVIQYGADVIMLPMVFDEADAKTFVEFVGGRAKTCVMIETAQAMSRIDDILEVEGIDELFFGLNDLHIGLGLSFLFEVLSGGLVEYMAEKCKKNNMQFGFGGIARIGDGMLPAEKILGEHVRLGSESVILSRAFKNAASNLPLKEEIQKIRKAIDEIKLWNDALYSENKKDVRSIVNKIVNQQ